MSTSLTIEDGIFSDEYDQHPKKAKTENSSLFDRFKNIASISQVLRLFGACAVIASMSLFLLNGWSEGNDIQRYLKLLAQTGLLTGAGIVLTFVLKESKGARLLFGLSLLSVVANFTILGALTYSMFQLDGGLIEYPSIVTWKAVSASIFWPVFAGAVTLLAILTRFSFSIFARSIAAPLSLNLLLMNGLLLIPVRSTLAISIIAVAALAGSFFLVRKLCNSDKVILTNESKFAFALMFAPGAMLIARAISLYSVDEIILVTLSGLAYFALRAWIDRFNKPSLMQKVVEKLQFCIAIFLSLQIAELLPYSLYEISGVILSTTILALCYDQIRTSRDANWQRSIVTITTIGLVIFNTAFAAFIDNLIVQVGSVGVCVVLFWFANFLAPMTGENKSSKVAASIGVIACLFILFSQVIAIIQLGNWIVIGLLGVSLIIGGSLFERYGMSLFSARR